MKDIEERDGGAIVNPLGRAAADTSPDEDQQHSRRLQRQQQLDDADTLPAGTGEETRAWLNTSPGPPFVRISEAGASHGSILAAGVAAIGAFLFGYSMGFTSPTLTAMELLRKDSAFSDADLEDLGDDTVVVTSSEAAQFSSIINIGAMFGSVLGGLACDAFGRRGTILLIAPVFGFAWAWTGLTSSYPQLLAARISVGLAVGVVSMTVPLYISETAPVHLRGSLGSVTQFAVTVGILVSYVVGIAVTTDQVTAIECSEPIDSSDDDDGVYYSISLNGGAAMTDARCSDFVTGWQCHTTVLPSISNASSVNATNTTNDMRGGHDDGAMAVGRCSGALPHWRVLAWAAAFAAALLFALMLAMPETPNWLLKHGMAGRAKRALLFLRNGPGGCINDEEIDGSKADAMDLEMKELKQQGAGGVAEEKEAGGGEEHIEGLTESISSNVRRSRRAAGERYSAVRPYSSAADDAGANASTAGATAAVNDDGDSVLQDDTASADDDRSEETGDSCFGYGMLWAEDMRRPMAMAIAMMLFQQLSGINAIIFFSGQILQAAGMDNANLGASIVMAVQVCFTGVAVVLMDRAGRRLLMAVSAAGMALAALAVAVFFANHKQRKLISAEKPRTPPFLLNFGPFKAQNSLSVLTPSCFSLFFTII